MEVDLIEETRSMAKGVEVIRSSCPLELYIVLGYDVRELGISMIGN